MKAPLVALVVLTSSMFFTTFGHYVEAWPIGYALSCLLAILVWGALIDD